MDMILLAAGASTRFDGSTPKFLLPMWDQRPMFVHAMEPFLDQVNDIYMIVQQQHCEQFGVVDTVKRYFGDRVKLVILERITSGPAETARQVCRDIQGSVFIKDCDSFFHATIPEGNYVCTTTWRHDDHSKGYVDHTDKIKQIYEKVPYGVTITVGGYCFADAQEFYRRAEDTAFISDVINRMIEHIDFHVMPVISYADVGTQKEYDHIMSHKFALRFDNSWAWVKTEVNENRHKDMTLLTVGDSFTWGDELGDSNGLSSDPRNDTEYRESKVFGRLLANRLDSNWVQHALPGGNNEWILEEIEKLVPQLYYSTKKLVVVFTLSEMGRELCNKDEYQSTAVIEFFKRQFREDRGILESMQSVELMYWQRLADLKIRYPDIVLLGNYGFTEKISHCEFLTEKNWIDIIFQDSGITDYEKISLFRTGVWVTAEFLEYTKLITTKHKEEVSTLYDSHAQYIDAIERSQQFFRRYHPREHGHELWADYLYERIQEQL